MSFRLRNVLIKSFVETNSWMVHFSSSRCKFWSLRNKNVNSISRISHCKAKGPFFNVRRPRSTLFQALSQWRRSNTHADDALLVLRSYPVRFCVRPHPTCGDSAYSTSGSQNIKPNQHDNSLFLAAQQQRHKLRWSQSILNSKIVSLIWRGTTHFVQNNWK